ncbi:EamA family transporter RarD [Salinispira pacifica]
MSSPSSTDTSHAIHRSGRDAAGELLVFLAFFMWGLLPFYWKWLKQLPPVEILCHRVLWSGVLMGALVAFRHRKEAVAVFRDRAHLAGSLGVVLLCALTLAANWLLYVWAVNSNHVVEASLGYYFTPLLNILFGVLFLRERPRRLELVALLLAVTGVVVVTVGFGRVPLISLGLALSFSLYGFLKKIGRLGAAVGLTFEMLLLMPAALVYVAVAGASGNGHFTAAPWITLLLVGSGLITAAPLLLFGAGARRVPLSSVGFFQYVAPTMMLLIGTLVYHEPFSTPQVVSFLFIWTALTLYTVSLFRRPRPAA